MAGEWHIKKGLVIDSLAGNNNEIVILDSTGKVISSSVTIDTIASSASVDSLRSEVQNISSGLNNRITAIESTYITEVEVAGISGYLQNQINTIPLSAYTTRTETANISGYLNTRINDIIDTTTVLGGTGIQVIELPNDTFTISVSGSYATTSQLAALTGSLQYQINTIPLSAYTTRVETANISAYLQNQINTIPLSAYTTRTETTNISAFLNNRIDYLTTTTSNISAGLNNRITNIENTYITTTSVSGISGYLQNQINSIPLSTYTLRTETAAVSGYLQNQINTIPLSAYTTRVETAAVSGFLNNRIDQITSENTIVIGGSGIQVIESPTQVFSISISADYATPTYVISASANAYNQSIAYTDTQIDNISAQNVHYAPSTPLHYYNVGSPNNVKDALDKVARNSYFSRQTVIALGSTGVVSGGQLGIASSTSILISGGIGQIINPDVVDAGNVPLATTIFWNTQTVSVPNITGSEFSVVYMTSSGTPYFIQNVPEPEDYRNMIKLGKVIHRSGTIQFTVNLQPYPTDIFNQYMDLAHSIGPVNLNGNVYSPGNPSVDLSIQKNEGQLYRLNSNSYQTHKNPHITTQIAQNPTQFFYVYRDNNDGAAYTSLQSQINPNLYDDGSGTPQSVPNKQWTIQRVYLFGASNRTYIFYGQAVYSSKEDALSGIRTENFVNPALNFYDAAFRAWVIIKEGSTNFSNSENFEIIHAGKFGDSQGGGGVGLQQSRFSDYDFAVYYDAQPDKALEFDLSALNLTGESITISANPLQDGSIQLKLPYQSGTLSLLSDVSNISGNLQDQINLIPLSSYTLRTETSSVSAYLQNQINTIPLSAYTTRVETAAVSGFLNNRINTLTTAVSAISGSLQNQINAIPLSSYTLRTETNAVSGFLQNQITNNVSAISSINVAISAGLKEPTGFENRTDSTLGFNLSTLTFGITGNHNIFIRGQRYTKPTATQVINASAGNHFIYYNFNNQLVYSQNIWEITTTVPIAAVYLDASLTKYFLFEERHGTVMDGETHRYLHFTRGAQYKSGLTIADYNLNSDTVADNKYSISSGDFFDEDILDAVNALSAGGPYTVLYRTGTSGAWTWSDTEAYPYFINANSIRYNEYTGVTWQLTDITTNNRWVNYYVFATNNINGAGVVIVPGQTIYSSLSLAQAESIASLLLGNFPFAECVPLYQITHQFSLAHATANGRARIVAVTNIRNQSVNISTTSASVHNNLSGLQGGAAGEYFHLTSSQYLDYIGSSAVATLSGSLQQQINDIPLSSYTLRTETAAVSAYLQNQINGISPVDTTIVLGGNGIQVVESPNDTFTVSVSGNYVRTLNSLSGNLQLIQGSNISITDNGSNQITISASISGGGTDHNTLANLQGGTTNEYYHLTAAQYSDYIGKSEVAGISGYLQNQINGISPVDTTIVLGGNGIQVVESPNDTFTVSVSGSYATTSQIASLTGSLQYQINTVPLSAYTTRVETAAVSGYLDNRITASSLPTGTTTGAILYWSGSAWVEDPKFYRSRSGFYYIKINDDNALLRVRTDETASSTEVDCENNLGHYTYIRSYGTTSGNTIAGIPLADSSLIGAASTNKLVFDSPGSTYFIGGSVISMTILGSTLSTGQTKIYYTTPSTSTFTGALVVAGGIGISGSEYVGGIVNATGNISTSGSLMTPIKDGKVLVSNALGQIVSSGSNVPDIYRVEVSQISGYLQNEIDSFTPSGTTMVLGGTGIQVVESPNSTFTVSVSGSYINQATLQSVSGQLQTKIFYNVKDYGAKGDNSTDDTTAIQNAINAANISGGIVFVPEGIYLISDTLTIYSNIEIMGVGPGSSEIRTNVYGAAATWAGGGVKYMLDGGASTDVWYFILRDISLRGASIDANNSSGVRVDAATNALNLLFENVLIYDIAGDGYRITLPVSSCWKNCRTQDVGGNAWRVSTATGCSWLSCYANGAIYCGYLIQSSASCSFQGCSADSCSYAYNFSACKGITLNGCGAEAITYRAAIMPDTPGIGYNIASCDGISLLSCYAREFVNQGSDVDSSKRFIKVDSSTSIVMEGCKFWFSSVGPNYSGEITDRQQLLSINNSIQSESWVSGILPLRYITDVEVADISGFLQTQIDNITGGGSTSINSLTGAITLSAGPNIQLIQYGNTIAISGSAGGSLSTVSDINIDSDADILLVDTGAVFDGAGSTPSSGSLGFNSVSYNGTIIQYTMIADTTGASAEIEIWKANDSIPTVSNKISGTGNPTLSNQQYIRVTDLSGWTNTNIARNDIIGYYLKSASSCSNIKLILKVKKT